MIIKRGLKQLFLIDFLENKNGPIVCTIVSLHTSQVAHQSGAYPACD